MTYFFILLVWLPEAFSADTSHYEAKNSLKDFLYSGMLDTKDAVLAPTHWERSEWLGFNLSAGSCLMLVLLDEDIQHAAVQMRTPWLDGISRWGLEPWGGPYTLACLGGFLAYGIMGHDSRSTRTALDGIKAYLISGMFARIPKYLAGRHRPYQNDPPYTFAWDGPGTRYTSFVSGHATTSFAVATVIASQYRNEKWPGILAYSVATLSSLSRIYDNKHWSSDIFAGAVLGYSIGKLVAAERNWQAKLTNGPLPGSATIAFQYTF